MARENKIVKALLAGRPERKGEWRLTGDDACVLPAWALAGEVIVASTDGLEEGIHFLDGWLEPEDLAWKLVAVNLSDLAAMGAEPMGYLMALAWPERMDVELAHRMGVAFRECEAHWDCPLLGGDTDLTRGPLRLTGTMLGRTPTPLLRSAAKAGDRLFVSGPLGGAAAVVARRLAGDAPDLSNPDWQDADRRFRRPLPRLDVSRRVLGRATAAIDLSDGLLPDLERLCTSSGLAARLDLESIPFHRLVRPATVRAWGLEGGEDYELLVAGPADLKNACRDLIEIGELVSGEPGSVEVAGL